jgi:hypothetical protein
MPLSKWGPVLQQANPTVQPITQGVVIWAAPKAVAFPNYGIGIPVASVSSPPLDVDYGPLAYGQFPGWNEVRDYQLTASAQVPQPGTSATVSVSFGFELADAMHGAGDPVPVLGPPLSPKIQGLAAFVAQSGVGLTPFISWSPPSLGRATSYEVSISPANTHPNYEALMFAVSGETSLRIPPGLLESGSNYRLVITAFQGSEGHYASADCVAAVFSP